jgi:hypothetical protein
VVTTDLQQLLTADSGIRSEGFLAVVFIINNTFGNERCGEHMSANWKSFVAAFGSFSAVLGVIATSSSAANLLIEMFQVPLGDLFQRYLLIYRSIINAIFYPLAAMHLHVPDIVKDLVIIWVMIASSTFRTYHLIRRNIPQEEFAKTFIDRENNPLAYFIERNSKCRVLLFCVIAWPYVMYRLFNEPLVWWNLTAPGV